MRSLAAILIALTIFMLQPSPSDAARDQGPPSAVSSGYELIVFEADGCVYCSIFRRDVLPLYNSSKTSREAPLRFINLTHSDESKLELAGAITIAPTIVLMRNGREVNRITGYTGANNFMKLVGVMMRQSN